MFSDKSYSDFKAVLNPIIKDCCVLKPTKENFLNNKYYVQRGVIPGTSKFTYAYDREKVDSYIPTFLKLAKNLPKFQKPSDTHAGMICTLDLFTNIVDNETSFEETKSQINLANHFINFLTLTNIAKVYGLNIQESSVIVLAIDTKYRDFMEKGGQEPADD